MSLTSLRMSLVVNKMTICESDDGSLFTAFAELGVWSVVFMVLNDVGGRFSVWLDRSRISQARTRGSSLSQQNFVGMLYERRIFTNKIIKSWLWNIILA